PFAHYSLAGRGSGESYTNLFDRLKHYSLVVVGFHNMNNSRNKDYGISNEDISFLLALQAQNVRVVAVVFGNPYSLKSFDDIKTVLCTYEEDEYSQTIAPQAIFGALETTGRMPVTASLEI